MSPGSPGSPGVSGGLRGSPGIGVIATEGGWRIGRGNYFHKISGKRLSRPSI